MFRLNGENAKPKMKRRAYTFYIVSLTKSPASPFGMQIFISEDLAVMISAESDALLRNT